MRFTVHARGLRELAGWAGLAAWLVTGLASRAAAPDYFFVTFEEKDGWPAGEWNRRDHALRLGQGTARIVATGEPESAQALELGPSTPFAAASLDASRLVRAAVLHCEFSARPGATDEQSGEEFFDFAGAVLGFFRVGAEGEVRALHGRHGQEALWISTGVRVPLDEAGLAAPWIRFGVRLSRSGGRWDLSVDGRRVLSGLKLVDLPQNERLPLYLLGQEKVASRFDDLLVSPVEPDVLEKLMVALAARAARRPATRVSDDRIVYQSKAPSSLRTPAAVGERPAEAALRLKGWQVTMHVGDRDYRGPVDRLDAPSDEPKIIAFSPGSEEAGHPLPQRITIVADAELRPGVNLRKLRWAHKELLSWPDKFGVTIAEGDFSTGLVQEITVPREWSRKATSVMIRVER